MYNNINMDGPTVLRSVPSISRYCVGGKRAEKRNRNEKKYSRVVLTVVFPVVVLFPLSTM